MRKLSTMLLAVALLAGCGGPASTGLNGGSGTPAGQRGMPGLPTDETPAQRLPAALGEVTVEGVDFYEKSFNASVVNGTEIELTPDGTDPLSWAIYRLPDISADYVPVSARVVPGATPGYWIAAADYQQMQWRFFTPEVDDEVLVSFDSGWEHLRSPAGHLYLAVVSQVPAVHSRIVFTVDDQTISPSGLELAQGCWSRFGGGADSGGYFDGVCGLTLFPVGEERVQVSIGDGSFGPNRCSPAIRPDGSVVALGRNGTLHAFPPASEVELWSFDPRDAPTGGQTYTCPPQTPCVDSNGNIYYVAIHVDSLIPQGVVWAVSATGEYLWDFGLGPVADDNDKPYPSLNISQDVLLAVGGDLIHDTELDIPIGIDGDGNEVWRRDDFAGFVTFHAAASVGASGNFELPAWFVGIALNERTHWLSLDPLTGDTVGDYQAFGSPENWYGGTALPGGLTAYPEGSSVLLLDSVLGELRDTLDHLAPTTGPTSRSPDARFVYQVRSAPPSGPGFAALLCAELDSGAATLTTYFDEPIESMRQMTCRVVTDLSNTLYGVADDTGMVWRFDFDADAPLDDDNPQLTKIYFGSHTYKFSSFALDEGAAYIVTEQENLIIFRDLPEGG